MMRSPANRPSRSPASAGALSTVLLAFPAGAAILAPAGTWAETAGFLWLVALLPIAWAGRLRGWRGALVMLGATMAFLLLVQLAAAPLGRPPPASLSSAIPLLLVLGTGMGWLSSRRPFGEGPSRGGAPAPAAAEGRPVSAVLFEIGSEAPGAASDPPTEALREIIGPAAVGGDPPGVPAGAVLALLEGSGEDAAAAFAERVRSAFTAASAPGDDRVVRAGVASRHPAMTSGEDLVAAALLALRRAREGGPGSIRIFGRPATAPGDEASEEGVRSSHDGGSSSPAARPAPEMPQGDRDRRRPDGTGRRVLVVEDDTPLRALVSMHLRRRGFSVEEGVDQAEGIRALREEFDAVITDLPGDEGEANLISAVKARWPQTPVVALTGFGDAEHAAEALQAGADRYLFKPFGIAELEIHLRDLLDRRDRLLRERRARRAAGTEDPEAHARARAAILEGARALVRAVEVRDPFTRDHGERVAEYSAAILRSLEATAGPTGIDADRLRLACELHDVGKLGVPLDVLNKEGRLTEEEYGAVRRHPAIGRGILSMVLDDELVLAVTAWHHERWDGAGYPDGLGGEAIPLPARLVAVADALDAMTSPRAYRPGLGWDDAVGQVRARTGTQFDPGLLSAFEEALPFLAEIHRGTFPPEAGASASPSPPSSDGGSPTGEPGISSSRPPLEPQDTG